MPAIRRRFRTVMQGPCLLTALLLLGLSGCISTSLVQNWRNPAFIGPPVHRVLVVGVQRDAARRRFWENSMVDALRRQHVDATPSYRLFPDRAPSAAQLAVTASRDGFDGILATHLVSGRTRNYWIPGYAEVGFGWRWRYAGYWGAVYGPGYAQSDYLADYQTDIFALAPRGGQLVWTGITRSIDLRSVAATTGQISRVLVPDLVGAHVLAPS